MPVFWEATLSWQYIIYDVACVVFCKCTGQCCSCIKSASIVPLKNEREQFVCMAILGCSSFSEGMYLCLPALWLHASPCPGAALPLVLRSFAVLSCWRAGCGNFLCFSRRRNEKVSCLELSWTVIHVCYLFTSVFRSRAKARLLFEHHVFLSIHAQKNLKCYKNRPANSNNLMIVQYQA